MIHDLFYLAILVAFSVCMFILGVITKSTDTSGYNETKAARLLDGQKTARFLVGAMTVILFLILLVLGVGLVIDPKMT